MRERLSMDKDWRFHLGELPRSAAKSHDVVYGNAKAGGIRGAAAVEWNDNGWETVQLPHDWSHRQPLDREGGIADFGYYPRGTGWYRKKFRLSEADRGKRLVLEFDGIATHAVIYFNGSVVERHFSGYTSFSVDITDRVYFGDQPNVLAVKADATVSEGWWYEGAGIYRHVWLTKTEPLHIGYRGVWVNPLLQEDGSWLTNAETTVINEGPEQAAFRLLSRVTHADGRVAAEAVSEGLLGAGETAVLRQNLAIQSPELWDVDHPHLYTLRSVVELDGTAVDAVDTVFGYRTIRVCPDTGFYLNGRRLKIKGTCNHQDHAGVGVAVPDSIHEYRIARLKAMGSNAYRCAHHNPAPELLDACDRLGMLVMDENRSFDSSREGLRQLENMVTRDRNHPSVVFYSLFNEEPLQGTPIGGRMAERMLQTVKRLDPSRPVLGAMHGGVMEEGGAAGALDVVGFNYMNGGYDAFKARFPDKPVIASETVSAFSTRGNYVSDVSAQVFDSFDREKADWGNTVRESWKTINERDFVMGTFVWTGFDYRGEPTPYEWPSVSTHFGIMDTCGFPKDAFYLYQAFWLAEPVLHIAGHWSWPGREGQPVKVMAHTNCDEVALYLNGRLIDRKPVALYEQCGWDIPYEPGILKMEGYRGGELVRTAEQVTPGEAYSLRMETHKPVLLGDGRDAVAVNVYAVDREGRFVPDAGHVISFTVEGAGIVLGTGNGDPNGHEPDHGPTRSLFNGCCQLIVQSAPGGTSERMGDTGTAGFHSAEENETTGEAVVLLLSASGLKPVRHVLPVTETAPVPAVPTARERYINQWLLTQEAFADRPDPHVAIHATDMNSWERVDAGFGSPQRLRGLDGYVIYRNRISVTEQENADDAYLWFHAISGDVEIYVDGELRLKRFMPWSEQVKVPLQGENGAPEGEEVTLSILMKITPDLYSPGINGAVSIRSGRGEE